MRFGSACSILMLIPLLAGCASPATEITALEAYAQAALVARNGQFVSIEGVEGPQIARHLYQPSEGDDNVVAKVDSGAMDDDGLVDGVLGDGRLSSWVVGFVEGDELVEVRVFADGRTPTQERRPLPEYLLDQRGALLLLDSLQDSDAAAATARGHPSFRDGASQGAGYLYSFSPYTRDLSPGPFLIGAGQTPLESLGWSKAANQWTVTRFDPTWMAGQPQAAAVATVDGFTGRVAVADEVRPVHRARVLLADETYGPLDLTGLANVITFDVPAGTSVLTGALYAQAHTAYQRNLVAPHLVLRQPNGDIAYEGAGSRGVNGLDLDRTPAGTWVLEVGHESEAPSSVHVYAFLWAVVSPGA
ncbi:MAG TPA: hypothetical protein VM327_00660 [Candidatus Thermoplasmatota archaeon]|nr:hypothetical protein [Candidatus Thermoplasmatota archaeon]